MPQKRRKKPSFLFLDTPLSGGFSAAVKKWHRPVLAYLNYYRRGRIAPEDPPRPVSGQLLREKGKDLLFFSRYLHLRQTEAVGRLLL